MSVEGSSKGLERAFAESCARFGRWSTLLVRLKSRVGVVGLLQTRGAARDALSGALYT